MLIGIGLYGDIGRQGWPQQVQGLIEEQIYPDGFLFNCRLTAEGENLCDQILGPIRGFQDFMRILNRMRMPGGIISFFFQETSRSAR
jgi:hypothetical protein